ncbi:bifunctional ADP-dependent NAD(P)H-hydrate dehydratase/NAD(P)H-hydrate epimerase [Barrientosiimonas marina]|uniref:Bifunctional NAD(P)H-hydrate repair enzyme n=1 Tax=Lentibacillus kimchii TaxID=1542911 RepID=A0ABW2UX50_9BACI
MYIVTAEEMYDMDREAIQDIGIDGRILMENAGRAMSDTIEARIQKTGCIRVLAGSGNNGGDGFVIARTLLDRGFDVAVVQIVPNTKISGEALVHKNLLVACGGHVRVTRDLAAVREEIDGADVIVDAMLGIGVKGKPREPLDQIITLLNQAEGYIMAVDIPSGLPANEGVAAFQAVQADETMIAGYPKMSAFLEATRAYYGRWTTVSIGLPAAVTAKHGHRRVWMADDFQAHMPERKRDSHKGDHGHGLVIGGNAEMPGSVAMTTTAALRSGAGLITAATTRDVIPVIAAHCMEATYRTLAATDGFLNNETSIPFDAYDAVVMGMGMGRRPETGKLVERVIDEAACPLIMDADALHHLKPVLHKLIQRTHPVVLTPHPGEMAMLLDVPVRDLLQSPFSYMAAFAENYQVYVILKGMFTIITAPDGSQLVSTAGNQGLAKGGSGDVLSGIASAMIMQSQQLPEALANACFVQGQAAELLTDDTHSVYDLMASDVIAGITDVYRTWITD